MTAYQLKALCWASSLAICAYEHITSYSTFRHTSWYHSVRLIVSRLPPSFEVKGQSSHVYFTGYHISHLSEHFHAKICVHRL